MAERVGFEPTVPLPGRMLSKHVDSSTLAPLRVEKYKGKHLSMRVHDQQDEQGVPNPDVRSLADSSGATYGLRSRWPGGEQLRLAGHHHSGAS